MSAMLPYADPYFPLLYAMDTAPSDDRAAHVDEGFQEGSFSMRCLQWG